jgi:hypothetical protein
MAKFSRIVADPHLQAPVINRALGQYALARGLTSNPRMSFATFCGNSIQLRLVHSASRAGANKRRGPQQFTSFHEQRKMRAAS